MRKFLLLLLATLAVYGCGGGSSPAFDSAAPVSQTRVVGRVELDVPMVGASVRLLTPTARP